MASKYTKDQILESIKKWGDYLVETKQMTRKEVDDFLGEGLLKKYASKISSGIKNAGKAVAGGIGNAATFIHDSFLKNDGVKKFIQCLKSAKDSGKNIGDAILVAQIDGKLYPILDVDIPKKFKKVLVMMINPAAGLKYTNGIKVSVLKQTLREAGIKKMSAEIDGIIAGTIVDSSVNEGGKPSSSSTNLSQEESISFSPPVAAESGSQICIADQNKLLNVAYRSKENCIGFVFDKSKAVKKQEAADDEILS